MSVLSRLPERLPLLPQAPVDHPWSADVITAYDELHTSFQSARRALNLDESDQICLRYYLARASGFMVDVVDALGLQEVDPLPSGHLSSVAEAIGSLIHRLREALDQASTQYVLLFCVHTC
jgi:hypothetical protein